MSGLNVRDALDKGIDILKHACIRAPVAEAGVILCHVAGKDKTFLFAHDEYILDDDEVNKFLVMINNRAKHVPLQYITGSQEFMSLDFIVKPGVFIPRQDTEALVETVIKHAGYLQKEKTIRILEIGTGSGCIAVSLAYHVRNCHIIATDISEKALETANLNAVSAGVENKINFIKSDLFSNITEHSFNMIISNPPYIHTGIIKELEGEVKDHEPLCAMDGGADGLDFYRAIVRDSKKFLNPNGLLAFEVGYNQIKDVSELMEKEYYDISTVTDLSGIERVVTGRLKTQMV